MRSKLTLAALLAVQTYAGSQAHKRSEDPGAELEEMQRPEAMDCFFYDKKDACRQVCQNAEGIFSEYNVNEACKSVASSLLRTQSPTSSSGSAGFTDEWYDDDWEGSNRNRGNSYGNSDAMDAFNEIIVN